jgi:hypothetical protein
MNLPFFQSWLSEPEKGFQPANAVLSWGSGKFSVCVDLIDSEVISTASANQQRLWELGDVVELFIQQENCNAYDEYQLSPNGYTLALHYPDLSGVASVRSGEKALEEFCSTLPFEAIASKTSSGWRAEFQIPIFSSHGIRVSCCRYDYKRGESPVLSSTSLHPVRNFHRPEDWMHISL